MFGFVQALSQLGIPWLKRPIVKLLNRGAIENLEYVIFPGYHMLKWWWTLGSYYLYTWRFDWCNCFCSSKHSSSTSHIELHNLNHGAWSSLDVVATTVSAPKTAAETHHINLHKLNWSILYFFKTQQTMSPMPTCKVASFSKMVQPFERSKVMQIMCWMMHLSKVSPFPTTASLVFTLPEGGV